MNEPIDPEQELEHRIEIGEASQFYDSITVANDYGLTDEYVAFFIRGIRAGKSVLEAMAYAAREWDIDVSEYLTFNKDKGNDAGIS